MCGKLGILTSFDLQISSKQTAIKKDKKSEEDLNTEEKDDRRFFAVKYTVDDIYQGVDEISRVYGFSGIKPNTILMPWPKAEKNTEKFGRLMTGFRRSNLNSIFLSLNEERLFGDFENIDIWWSGAGSNLSFSISIVRYLTSGKDWKSVKVRLFVPVDNPILTEKVYKTLERIVDQYRILIEIKVVNNSLDKLEVSQLIQKESMKSDLTVVGIANKKYDNINAFVEEVDGQLPSLGSVLLVNATSIFEEYDLELDEKITIVDEEDKVELAHIPQFTYPTIGHEVHTLDKELLDASRLYIEKALLPHYLDANDWIQSIKESIESAINNFLKANEIEDSFRRNKAYFKIKNEYYFKINSIFEKKQSYKFNELKHYLESGFDLYLKEQSGIITSRSTRFRIEHSKLSFKIHKGDAVSLKRFKLWKLITNLLSKKTIPVQVNYRKMLDHYIRNKQQIAILSTISDFEDWSYKMMNSLRTQINSSESLIDEIGYQFVKGKLSKLVIEKQRTKQLQTLQELEKYVKLEQKSISISLQSIGRNDIIELGIDLEEIQVNKIVNEKSKLNRIAQKAKREVVAFPEKWHYKAVLFYNKLSSEVVMTSFQSRVMKLIDDYKSDINASINSGISKDISQLKKKIEQNAFMLEEVRKLKTDVSAESITKVFGDFDRLNLEVIKLIDGLPKEVALPFEDESKKGNIEAVQVPMSKITRHFYETRFVGQIAGRLEKSEEEVTKIIHEISDQMNLTRFSIDNLDEEAGIGEQNRDVIINDILSLLNEKEEEINNIHEAIFQQFENAIEEAFDPLASYKIIESARAFNSQLRTYQGKKIRNILGYKSRRFNTSIMKHLAKLWYSKSEGVLLAKRLMETEKYKSSNEQILDAVELLTPSPKVMNSIPHYYKSLFSDRSNISEEFWVEMKREEEAFKKAIDRYKTGIKGGILITGERNCGKTNLCQNVLRKQFNHNQIYHVFPPVEGSVDLEDYEQALGKVTGISRQKSEIYNTLQFGSVIVFHDLELWWERSLHGLNLIKEIVSDINRYSKSYLFVVNANIYAYELLNNILQIHENLIGVIQCQPFDTEGLQSLIIKRHSSSGLQFSLEGREEKSLSQLKMAKIFSRYFDQTKGNPGVALYTWLNSIVQYKNETLTVNYPANPDGDILKELDFDDLTLLQQIALHKRMDRPKLARVFDWEVDTVEDQIRPLRLNGLLHEKSEGVFVINPYVEQYVVKVLKQNNLL